MVVDFPPYENAIDDDAEPFVGAVWIDVIGEGVEAKDGGDGLSDKRFAMGGDGGGNVLLAGLCAVNE